MPITQHIMSDFQQQQQQQQQKKKQAMLQNKTTELKEPKQASVLDSDMTHVLELLVNLK